jgi:hypothetical protein
MNGVKDGPVSVLNFEFARERIMGVEELLDDLWGETLVGEGPTTRELLDAPAWSQQ